MSLDGSIAGPNAGVGNPLGDEGDRLHEWAGAKDDKMGPEPIELEITRVIDSPGVTHLLFRVVA